MECRGIVFDPRLPRKTSLLAIALIVAASLGFASLLADERVAPKTPEVAYTNCLLIWTFGGTTSVSSVARAATRCATSSSKP